VGGVGTRLLNCVDHRLGVRWSSHHFGEFIDPILKVRAIVAKLFKQCDHLGDLLLAQDRQLATLWPLPYETGDLLDVERRVLECLGAALVSEWNGLPTDVQRRLFEHAASGASRDAAQLKSRIARFLHDHKDASESR